MADRSKIDLFLKIGLLFLVSVNLAGCLPVSNPGVTTAPNISVTEIYTPAPSLFPVFPGAEGFGAMTGGGRGGKVIEVTVLEDSGPGSLRAAVSAEGPRIIVFRVAGDIEHEYDL